MNPPIPLPLTSLERDLDFNLPVEPERSESSQGSGLNRPSGSRGAKRQRGSPSIRARGIHIPDTIPEEEEDEEQAATADRSPTRKKRAVRATGSAGRSQQVQQGGSELQTSLQSITETVSTMMKSMAERDDLRWERDQQVRQEKEERRRKEKEEKEEKRRKEKEEEKEERRRKEELDEKRRQEDRDLQIQQMNLSRETNNRLFDMLGQLLLNQKPPGDGSGSSAPKGG